MIITELTHHYHECKTSFISHNKLHDHIYTECKSSVQSSSSSVFKNSKSTIIKSVIKSKKLFKYSFKKWHYITIRLYLTNSAKIDESCLDSDCLIILINQKFLKIQNKKTVILIKTTSILIRDFDQNKHNVTKFI